LPPKRLKLKKRKPSKTQKNKLTLKGENRNGLVKTY